jgi:mono/diheme cytochrome c family protein
MRSVVVVGALALVVGCEGPAEGPTGTTYHADVEPLLMTHCASCHQAGGIAPFALLTYDDAFANKDAIAFSVANRRMPPWNLDNTGDCKTYRDARWLEDDEIALITGWVDNGAPEGERPGQALAPPPPDHLDDEGAVYLEMAEPYTPTPQPDFPGDDYRCFFLDPGNTADAFVTGFEIVPGQPQEVHHMLLFSLLETDAEQQAQALDDDDPAPGWTCFGAAGDGVDEGDILLLAGWAPGTNVKRYPEGTGIFVPANRRMVMQIHYNLLGGAAPDLTGIKVALEATVDKQAMLLPLADDSFELPPNEPLVTFDFSQSLFGLAEPLEVHGVFPHMHKMGQTLRVTKGAIGDLDGSDAECLADVPRWDFSWQEVAFYDEPVLVDGSNQIDVTCTWDTSGRTTPTFWGEGTSDEMCLAFVYVTRTNGGPVSDLL